jgi:hypothetical protein
MKQRNKEFEVETRIWDGSQDEPLIAWLGESFVRMRPGVHLTVRTGHGLVRVRPGWTVAWWEDGELMVFAPPAAARILQPAEPE